MYFSLFLIVAFSILILVAQYVFRRQLKPQQAVAQYIVAPIPESKETRRFPLGVIFSLVVATALILYLFVPIHLEIYDDYESDSLSPSIVGTEEAAPPSEGIEDSPEELAEFEF